VSSIQVTTRYNSTPVPGTGGTDNLELLTLGDNFDTTRNRQFRQEPMLCTLTLVRRKTYAERI